MRYDNLRHMRVKIRNEEVPKIQNSPRFWPNKDSLIRVQDITDMIDSKYTGSEVGRVFMGFAQDGRKY